MSRTTRYDGLGLMSDAPIHIIGTGAIGRQVALTLAIMGWPGQITLYDFDTVEDVNLGTQGFAEQDLGKEKIDAVSEAMKLANPAVQVRGVGGRITPGRLSHMTGVIFACVDSMKTRKMIVDNSGVGTELLLDARMAAEVFTVLAIYDEATAKQYEDGWFSDADAHDGACTARSTYYCANISAGFMIAQLTKYTRGIPLEADVRLDLLGMGLMVSLPKELPDDR